MNMWDLWSKTDRESPKRWHALPWHLIEVGAVAEQIWRSRVPSPIQERFSTRLGVDDSYLLARWIGFITACHDLGKVSAKFQGLVPEQAARLKALSPPVITMTDQRPLKHGLISAAMLPDVLRSLFGMEGRVADRYAYLTGGHHGVMWSTTALRAVPTRRKATGRAEWDAARRDVVALLAEAFEIPNPLPGNLATYRLPYEDAIWLAGLITAADWLGSDEKHFTYLTEPASAQDARKLALARANRAMGRSGWYHAPVAIPTDTFGAAIRSLPPGSDPYPAQDVAIGAIGAMSGPGIVVVEYPMGWGKTEIALWAAAHWAEQHHIPGFYVAMPTMTTSDQLHRRVTDHLASHLAKGKANLQLLHGQAELSTMPEIDELPHEVPDEEFDTFDGAATRLAKARDPEEGVTGRVQRTIWFTKRKRGLLATYGVGTVDQVLMSVLQTKHFFVRTYGLGGKTVVFDEVHSYDVYMSTLFDNVLRWLGALGSPVVILSATLPAERTRQMIAAYQEGAGWASSPVTIDDYPRITVADAIGARSFHGPSPAHESSRTVSLRMVPTDVEDDALWAAVGPRLNDALADGGTAAVICNTVRQAQEAWRALQQWFAADELTLFHARFRQMDRKKLQDNVLGRFGKDALRDDSEYERPHRHVVIATQVIEQSLDLDFDMMVSMFCPTDLLLQRMGRMQRHSSLDHLRQERFRGKPELWVIGVNDVNGVPQFPVGSKMVYAPYVLIRSWAALQGRASIVIPDDIEALIESTYAEDVPIPPHLEPVWRDSQKIWDDKVASEANTAKSVGIPSLADGNDPGRQDVLTGITSVKADQDDEPFLHASALAQTRLGDPSVSIVVLTPAEAARYATSLTASGDEPLPLQAVRPMLRRAVNVSLRNVVNAAIAVPVPKAWERTTHLGHHRLVVLDESNRGSLGELVLKLHPTLGVLFVKEVEEGEPNA